MRVCEAEYFILHFYLFYSVLQMKGNLLKGKVDVMEKRFFLNKEMLTNFAFSFNLK